MPTNKTQTILVPTTEATTNNEVVSRIAMLYGSPGPTNQWDDLVFCLFRDEWGWEYREPNEEVANRDRGRE